jgi:hypothetical protein
LSCREIARELPGRTLAAVAARARKIGLATHGRLWTAADACPSSGCGPAANARLTTRCRGSATSRPASARYSHASSNRATRAGSSPWPVASACRATRSPLDCPTGDTAQTPEHSPQVSDSAYEAIVHTHHGGRISQETPRRRAACWSSPLFLKEDVPTMAALGR